MSLEPPRPFERDHRFLDEAGDTTFFERGETRYYDYVRERIALVIDLYDAERYEGSHNYYTPRRPLTAQNKLGPPAP